MTPQRVRLMANAAMPGRMWKTPMRMRAGATNAYPWAFSMRIRRRRDAARVPADSTSAATVGDDRRAMPIYDYHCDHCGHAFSAVQSFKDDPLSVCPSCGKRPRRLLSTPAIVFKGSGWYKTDSRSSSKSSADKDGGKAESTEA